MKAKISSQLDSRKRRIEKRLDRANGPRGDQPVFTASNIHFEIADRTHGIAHGGIGVVHALAREIGLIDAIDSRSGRQRTTQPDPRRRLLSRPAYNTHPKTHPTEWPNASGFACLRTRSIGHKAVRRLRPVQELSHFVERIWRLAPVQDCMAIWTHGPQILNGINLIFSSDV